MSLDGTFYLGKALRFSDTNAPLNTNDRLPIVYGTLTGDNPVWNAPNIDYVVATNTYVYCFADHSVPAQVPKVWVENVEWQPGTASGTFTFSETDSNYGGISTITLHSPTVELGAGKKVSVNGQGKPYTKIIDIIDDFLGTELGTFNVNNDYNRTFRARAIEKFDSQGYIAAGTITKDESVWTILYKMLSSFKGDAFRDNDGKLKIIIDDGQDDNIGVPHMISTFDINFLSATVQEQDLMNRIPCSYSYSPLNDGHFASHTNKTIARDEASVGIWGEKKASSPYRFYFCRDLTSVLKVQGILIKRFSRPITQIDFVDPTLKSLDVDLGDTITTSFDFLYNKDGEPLINEHFQVLTIDHIYDTLSIRYRVIPTGNFMTTGGVKLDGSFKLDGTKKLTLSRDTTIY